MLIQAIPLFEDAHILRRDMLEALSDYAFLLEKHRYKGYENGILAGCELTTTQDSIILNEGLLLFDGWPFLVKEPLRITYHPTNKLNVLKLLFSDEMRDANSIYREFDILLSENTELLKGELELGRFTLQEGAQLRYEYRNFEDRDTTYDTLNRIYVPYAARKNCTLSPDITGCFAREMLSIPSITDFDALFCMQILGQHDPVTKEALAAYLLRKGREVSDLSNKGVYRELLEVIKQAQGTTKEKKTGAKKKWSVTLG